VDSSFSTTEKVFQQQIQFISQIIKRITVSNEKFEIAVISYGTEAIVDIPLGSLNISTAIIDRISNISFINGTTDIAKACQKVREILPPKQYTSQFVFLLTDGMPSNLEPSVNAISSLRYYLRGSIPWNDVLLIAVGEDVRHEGFRRLSINGNGKIVFSHLNMDALHHVFKKLTNDKCTGMPMK
jgi:uncharacterized protein YegL